MPGDYVTVLDPHTLLPDYGWVDDLTEDGAMIWIILCSGGGRRMFFRQDGLLVTVEVSQSYA